MTSGPAFTDRRSLVTVLSVAMTVFFALLLVVPASPGYLRPGTVVALAISLVNMTFVRRAARPRWWLPPAAALSMTLAMGVAAADGSPGRESELFLFWFPWIACYCGLLPLGWSLVNGAVIALTILVAASVNADLAGTPALLVSSIASSVVVCLTVQGLCRWGRAQAFSDPLTSLVNRSGLASGADPAIARAREKGREAVLVLLDINRFREVNDALGHEAGDELLRLLARRLPAVRPEPSFVGRLGGDEFALVIADPGQDEPSTPEDHLRELGRSVLRQIEGPFVVRGVTVEVEASVGIAVAPRDGETVGALLPCADAALSRAKREGERVGLWDAGIAGVRSWEIALYAELRAAITRGELILFYQPLQSAPTGRIVGVEALVRWRHPVRGLLPPGSFLPMAERSALIVDVTRWVLDEALRQCAAWAAEGLHVPVSVNLSARMLVGDDLPGLVTDSLARHRLPPDVLTLEITESALVTQPTRAAAMLRDLRTKGVKLSLDDFGTGYSSIEILKALPFDEVKIDRGFVADARGSLQDVAIVRSVLDLGHRLGLRVVGEGVEDATILRMMTELGCDFLQGDAISRPRPAGHLVELLTEGTSRPHGDVLAARRRVGTVDRAAVERTPARDGGPARGGGAAGGDRPTGQEGPDHRVPPGQITGKAIFTRSQATRCGVLAPPVADEAGRLAARRRYDLAYRPGTYPMDDLAILAAALTGCTQASFLLVNADSASFIGRYAHELVDAPARVGIASHVVAAGELIEISDVLQDTRFAHTAKMIPDLPVRFLAGVPVVTDDGYAVGSIMISDRIPRRLTPGQREAMESLARQAMVMLDARRERALIEMITDAVRALDHLWYPDDLPAAASLVGDVARELLGASVVTVLVSDLPGSTIFSSAGSSALPGVEPIIKAGDRFSASDDTAIGEVLRTQKPLFIPDAGDSPGGDPRVARERGMASALFVPLPGEGGTVAVLSARWPDPVPVIDPRLSRTMTLLAGQAGHTLGRLRAARSRDLGTDVTTGLTSRAAFLTTLQGLPAGTGVCLFALGRTASAGVASWPDPATDRGGGPVALSNEPVALAADRDLATGDRGVERDATIADGREAERNNQFSRFVECLRAVCDNPAHLARWSSNRFVMAVPAGGRERAETAAARVRAAWEREARPPVEVGISVTRGNEPPSAALLDAETRLLHAIEVAAGRVAGGDAWDAWDDPADRPAAGRVAGGDAWDDPADRPAAGRPAERPVEPQPLVRSGPGRAGG